MLVAGWSRVLGGGRGGGGPALVASLGTALVGVSAVALRLLEPWLSGPVIRGGTLATTEASGVGRPSTVLDNRSWLLLRGPAHVLIRRLCDHMALSFCSEEALIVFLKDGLRLFQILRLRGAFDE